MNTCAKKIRCSKRKSNRLPSSTYIIASFQNYVHSQTRYNKKTNVIEDNITVVRLFLFQSMSLAGIFEALYGDEGNVDDKDGIWYKIANSV